MNVAQWESLVEVPREGIGPLTQFIPDTPWTTTTLQALQNRKASVFADVLQAPRNLVVRVKGGDEPGDHDQAYIYGLPNSEPLRAFVSSVDRATEFIADEELVPMVREIHPDAVPREAVCLWFDKLGMPPGEPASVPIRRLRNADAENAVKLIPHWAFRTFESPKDMIMGGACYGVELNGKLACVAYVADQSIKYARVSVVTAEPFRRKGYAFAAARKLIEHCMDEGRLVCAYAPRPNVAAVRFALKLAFPQKAMLRTYKVMPKADAPA